MSKAGKKPGGWICNVRAGNEKMEKKTKQEIKKSNRYIPQESL